MSKAGATLRAHGQVSGTALPFSRAGPRLRQPPRRLHAYNSADGTHFSQRVGGVTEKRVKRRSGRKKKNYS